MPPFVEDALKQAPRWALGLAFALLIAIFVWLQNNESRFYSLQIALRDLEHTAATISVENERRKGEIATVSVSVEKQLEEIRVSLDRLRGFIVDQLELQTAQTNTKIAGLLPRTEKDLIVDQVRQRLAEIDKHFDAIDRHLEATDERLTSYALDKRPGHDQR